MRSAEEPAIRMRLGFEWQVRRLYADSSWTHDFYTEEAGCSATQQFNPEPDKVYLVSYTLLPRRCGPDCWLPEGDCQVAIFLETPTGIGTFKLEPVGEPYAE